MDRGREPRFDPLRPPTSHGGQGAKDVWSPQRFSKEKPGLSHLTRVDLVRASAWAGKSWVAVHLIRVQPGHFWGVSSQLAAKTQVIYVQWCYELAKLQLGAWFKSWHVRVTPERSRVCV